MEPLEVVLQKQRSWAYNGRNYYRYRITVPAKIAYTMGLVGGERLDVSIIHGAIIIRRTK